MMLSIPSRDPKDPSFKKLVYIRYADDWIIGIRGSINEARTILNKISEFLNSELSLNLNSEKTLITNAKLKRALFLGTSIGRSQHRTFSLSRSKLTKRNALGIRLEAPIDRISRKLTETGFMKNRIPIPKFLWLAYDKDEIITLYNAVFRGFTNYYSFAMNYGRLVSWLHLVLKTSCAKLLAAKLTLGSQSQIYKKFGKDLKGDDKIGFIKPRFNLSPYFGTSSIKK